MNQRAVFVNLADADSEIPAQPGERTARSAAVTEATPAAWVVRNPFAQRGDCLLDVAVIVAANTTHVTEVVGFLASDSRIASATGINVVGLTPTLAELHAFDSVLVFSNNALNDNETLGDNLANYVDGGGGVVLGMFTIRASVSSRTIGGRFLSENYYCITQSVGSPVIGEAVLGTIHIPDSPLLAGVSLFHGGIASYRSPAGLHPNATRIADWSTGETLIARRSDLFGERIDLGFYPPSELSQGDSWLSVTDGDQMIRNAVVAVGRCKSGCTGDVDGDGDVDLADLALVLGAYGTSCP